MNMNGTLVNQTPQGRQLASVRGYNHDHADAEAPHALPGQVARSSFLKAASFHLCDHFVFNRSTTHKALDS